MKLTSEYPYWAVKNGLVSSFPSLHNDVRCDCVVIGAGITGALVGYHLAAAGVETIVLDKRDAGTGSTSASTGLLQYEVDTPLRCLIQKVGEKNARRSYELCGEAIDKLLSLTRKLGIACGFRKVASLQIARHKNEIPDLREEYRLRKEMGIQLQLWDSQDIRSHFPFKRPAALFSSNGGEVDPHLLTHGLLHAGGKLGLKIFDRTEVKNIITTPQGVMVRTKEGIAIQARRAVLAAGYESKEFLHANSGSLKSTYAVISEPMNDLSGWYRNALIWETGLPYLYLRTLPDRRIIVGGEDEPFVNPKLRDSLIAAKTRILNHKFQCLFPKLSLEVAYSWAGTFGETKDGLPYIDSPPGQPHTYCALGYGGNGITYSLIAAEIIRDLFLGRSNPDASIFRFNR